MSNLLLVLLEHSELQQATNLVRGHSGVDPVILKTQRGTLYQYAHINGELVRRLRELYGTARVKIYVESHDNLVMLDE